MTPEQKLTQAVIRNLKARRKAGEPIWWLKVHGGPQQQAGVPDLLICYYGLMLAVELKAGDNQATPLQRETIRRIRAAGGVAEVARTPAEVERLLNHMKG